MTETLIIFLTMAAVFNLAIGIRFDRPSSIAIAIICAGVVVALFLNLNH